MGLFETYSEMALVVNQPDLFGMFGAIDAFDVDPKNAKIALTTTQGVFEPPLKDGEDNPARHVRLGLGFFAPEVTPEFAAFILIHELTHFTGRRDGESIVDNGRGWFDDVFIRPLGTARRLLNADSYASFAHECRTGNASRPPFVKTAPGGLGGAGSLPGRSPLLPEVDALEHPRGPGAAMCRASVRTAARGNALSIPPHGLHDSRSRRPRLW